MILQPPPAARKASATTISRGPYRIWPDAFRLTNGLCELVIVPSIGRIMHFAPVDGDNVLWENPKFTARSASREFVNPGGDAVYPWPQDRWPRVLPGGRDWPPPEECWRRPQAARVIDGSVLRLTSAPLPAFGVRIVREISLADGAMRATMVNRFERLHVVDDNASGEDVIEDVEDPDGPPRPPCSWAVWPVTAVKPPQQAMIRLDSRASLPGGIREMVPGKKFSNVSRDDGLLVLGLPPRAGEAKMGAEGDAVAAAWRGLVFTQKRVPPAPGTSIEPKSRWMPGEACQVYSSRAYAELELTGARWMHAPELIVEWELERTSTRYESAASDWLRAV